MRELGHNDGVSMLLTDLVIRLRLAVLLAALIGIDREIKSGPAGLRTRMLTSLAGGVFTLIATFGPSKP